MLVKVAIGSLFILLVWGNIVAGLKVGLACPDWPLCYGEIVPQFRWDIYVEFIHRVLGAITSVILFILSYKRYKNYKGIYKTLPLLIILLLTFQIILGGIVVLSKLQVDLTTLHFANAIIIFAITLYIAYFDGEKNIPSFKINGAAGLFFGLSILIFLQAVLGAYVRHSQAGLACPDFPKCLGYWIPPELSGKVLVHFSHRIIAYLIFIIFLTLYFISKTIKNLNPYRKYINLAILFVLFQIILGIAVVYTKLTFYITALHISFALIILSITLFAWFKLSEEQT